MTLYSLHYFVLLPSVLYVLIHFRYKMLAQSEPRTTLLALSV